LVDVEVDAEVRAALQTVATATVLDLNPGIPLSEPHVSRSVWALVAEAGTWVNDELDLIAQTGTPTGRAWAVMLLETRDPARAREHLLRMRGDRSPIQVNTCLVGYRTLDDWVRSRLGGGARPSAVSVWLPRVKRGSWLLALGVVGWWCLRAFGML
jgi:hypothetical protein